MSDEPGCTYCTVWHPGAPCLCAYLAAKLDAGEPYALRDVLPDPDRIERDARELARIRDAAREWQERERR